MCLLAVFLASSCSRVPTGPAAGKEVRLQITTRDRDTKSSRFSDRDSDRLVDAVVYGIDETGYWKRIYLSSADGRSATTSLRFPSGARADIYVLANMGDIRVPEGPDGIPDFDGFTYLIPEKADFSQTGFPMASHTHSSVGSLQDIVSINLNRLIAKVEITIDKQGLTGGATPVLLSEHLLLRRASRRLCPFSLDGSSARGPEDLFDAPFDSHWFAAGEGDDLKHQRIALYVPENVQPARNAETFIEYRGSKDGSADGVEGTVTYRCPLESISGTSRYLATLSLTWDGLVWKADGWKIDTDEVTDGRRLRFLDADGNETDYLKIRRKDSGEVYAYFSVDGGRTGTVGRKDAASYPYGWRLCFNGSTLSGHDADAYEGVAKGISVQCLGEAVVGGKNALRLRISASQAADVTTADAQLRHQLSLCTTDGKVSALPLYLDVEDLPFTYEWVNGVPDHVGQKGVLRCLDPYTGLPSAHAVFHLKDGQDALSPFTDNGDGTVTVSLTGAFGPTADAITLTDRDGDRACAVPLEARVPHFLCSDLWTTYVDASSSMQFTYYGCKADGSRADTPLRVVAAGEDGYTGNGTQLDRELTERFLAPACRSENGRLGFSRHLMEDGTYSILASMNTFTGINPSGKSFTADWAQIGMEGPGSVRGFHTTPFTAWNPWQHITGIVEGKLMNDYTLYCEPNIYYPYSGWNPSPTNPPVETKEHTMTLKSLVVASEHNLSMDAHFATGEYLGAKVFCGTPGKVSSGFAANSYALYVMVDPAIGNESAAQLLAYLQERGFLFHDAEEMRAYLSQNGGSLILGDAFPSVGAAQSAAPKGVFTRSGQWVDGCRFEVSARGANSQWTLTYSMRGITREDITTHGAGKLEVVVRIRNPYDGSCLERQVGEAFMRLHIYAWPIIFGPYPPFWAGEQGSFGIGLYAPVGPCTTTLYHVIGKEGQYTQEHNIARAKDQIGFRASNYPASVLPSRDETFITPQASSIATTLWNLPADWSGMNSYDNLMARLSMGMDFPMQFKYRNELENIAKNCFYRESDYRICYDPTGDEYEFSYDKEGFKRENTGKLFVINLGDGLQGHFAQMLFGKNMYFSGSAQ